MTETRVAASDRGELALTVSGVVPLLTPHFRVAVYDQRGIGASELTPGPYTTEQLGDNATAVLAGLEVEQATVLGASFGGMVAQQLGVRHADRVGALVLGATGPGSSHLAR